MLLHYEYARNRLGEMPFNPRPSPGVQHPSRLAWQPGYVVLLVGPVGAKAPRFRRGVGAKHPSRLAWSPGSLVQARGPAERLRRDATVRQSVGSLGCDFASPVVGGSGPASWSTAGSVVGGRPVNEISWCDSQ
jgi:hypothetical protein